MNPSTSSAALHARLRQAFGEPQQSLGDDHHWGFRSDPAKPWLNVLIDVHRDNPAVWVFDPYETAAPGVYVTSIADASQIDDFMKLLQERIQRAVNAPARPIE